MFRHGDTIVAPATAPGGALALIRISGPDALVLCDRCFRARRHDTTLAAAKGYTAHFGTLNDPDGRFIDEVIVTVFRAPASYTGEETAEISCHDSRWIVSAILRTLIHHGARPAEAGEFTARAFLAGKLDLSQAEAVADLIASDNRAAHDMAATQLRGHYSDDLHALRAELLRLAALLELELDFSEEDVIFADRSELYRLLERIQQEIGRLTDSFALGNAIREGVAVAIVGEPNVGKSTLLNRLAGDDRAMVSDIAGTTRDTVEERITIGGIGFRFIDTAGIRQSDDPLEQMGIERTYRALDQARIVLFMADSHSSLSAEQAALLRRLTADPDRKVTLLLNKCDDPAQCPSPQLPTDITPAITLPLSAKYGYGIDRLTGWLTDCVDASAIFGGESVVSNVRHYDRLRHASETLTEARRALDDGLPTDLVAEEIRDVLRTIGEITGEITDNDILGEIFSKFCIGK